MASIEPKIRKMTEQLIPELNPEQTGGLSKIFKKARKNGYLTKDGGNGVNRTDGVMFITSSSGEKIPVIVEYKGTNTYTIDFKNRKNKSVLLKNKLDKYDVGQDSVIADYAVNGACYYATVALHNSSDYKYILAIGINGWIVPNKKNIHYEAVCYSVSSSNPDNPVPFNNNYKELNSPERLKSLLVDNAKDTANDISIPEPQRLEIRNKNVNKNKQTLEKNLKKLNQDIYNTHLNIVPSERIALVVSCLLASIDVEQSRKSIKLKNGKYKIIDDIEKQSNKFFMNILRSAIDDELAKKFSQNGKESKANKHSTKYNILADFISPVFSNTKYSKKVIGNDSVTQYIYKRVSNSIYPEYKMCENDGESYFANVLYDVMTSWLTSEQLEAESKDDVVLTPSYVANLMAKIAQVNKKSHVWDWALGSGGLLISAMNQMIKDAKDTDTNSDNYNQDIKNIRNNRLLGIEKLPDIYVLALVNMILAQDGKSEILNQSSIGSKDNDFNVSSLADSFNADCLLLNPPYDQGGGHGMIFAEEAMEHMTKGYAVIIIERSSGSGEATDENKAIMNDGNALIASIKMPHKLFKIPTEIYLFKIGTKKNPCTQNKVIFVDFSDDGYTRGNHKHSSKNTVSRTSLDGKSIANHRYSDLYHLINEFINYNCHNPKPDIKSGYFKDNKHYIVGSISTDESDNKYCNDWNYDNHLKNNLSISDSDIDNTVKEYLKYRLDNLL